jgi:hypothetical protein
MANQCRCVAVHHRGVSIQLSIIANHLRSDIRQISIHIDNHAQEVVCSLALMDCNPAKKHSFASMMHCFRA